VLRAYDALANLRVRILKSAPARIAIISSQSAQFSVLVNLQLKAQKKGGECTHLCRLLRPRKTKCKIWVRRDWACCPRPKLKRGQSCHHPESIVPMQLQL
jgi:hypothetical protein